MILFLPPILTQRQIAHIVNNSDAVQCNFTFHTHWRINYFSSFSSSSSSFSCSCSYSFHLFLFFSSFLLFFFLLFFCFFFFICFSSSFFSFLLLIFFFSSFLFLLFFSFFFFICFSSSSVLLLLLLLLLVILVSDSQFTSTEEMQYCLSDAVSKRPLMLDFILQLVTLLYIIVAIMSCSLQVP